MKMNKKGFTLIELLAVIVVLAIIALIATPIVMTTINNAKKQTIARSLESYAAQLELGYADAMLDATKTTDEARQAAAKTYADDNTKGDKPDVATIIWGSGNGVVEKISATYDEEAYCYKQADGAQHGVCTE